MRLCVYEDPYVSRLEPLTLTRPAFDLLCGASSLLQWQTRYFGATEVGALVRQDVADVCRQTHPALAVNDATWMRGGVSVLVNACWLPPDEPRPEPLTPRAGMIDDEMAYAVLPSQYQGEAASKTIGRELEKLRDPSVARIDWSPLICSITDTVLGELAPAGGAMIDYPWDLLTHNGPALRRVRRPEGAGPGPLPPGLTVLGPAERLFLDPAAQIEPLVVADTRHGPVIVDRGAWVKAFSRLEGPCYIGPETWLIAARVTDSTIGPVCRIGGDVEESIVHGYSNKAHEGFLGHSYVGEWVNLAAGTQVSDLRTDYQPIRMTMAGRPVDTGLTKVGSFLGDHTKTGINTLLNTGTTAGVFCQIYPSNLLPPRVVPSFSRFARGELEPEDGLAKLLTTAGIMMKRRSRELDAAHEAMYRRLYEQARAAR